ncbi:YHYH protein [Larkinella rosea]|uniref:YHYH protein n=1 Tax=Larkinella rosea TaxID=2025312 RepID=A0A3P1BS99_9BACT|nr:YHYH protein [Larkinella rosea]RRB03736.1 YHYH protein [Larkinella rosea]
MNKPFLSLVLTALTLLTGTALTVSCMNDDDPESSIETTDVPDVYRKIYGATSITRSGDYILIKTTGVPDHKSPYFQNTQWATAQYEAYNGTNAAWHQNPNKIASFNYTFRLPVAPKEAVGKSATDGGPIGVSLNGVPFFNQYAAMRAALTDEVNGFDQYNGHPAQAGDYHYHAEPTFLTTNKGKEALMGFLLDGFPVYGPIENGKLVTNLDKYHGHSHATADFPSGIYHYHITAADPYINGNGYYGTPGTYTK